MKHLIPILFLTALLCSCAGTEDLDPDKDLCEVRFTSSGVQTSATRSSTFLPLGSSMDIAAFTVASGVVSDTYKAIKTFQISDNAGTLAAADGKDLYLGSNNYRFYAWSPSKTLSGKILSITPNEDLKVTSQDALLQAQESKTIDFPAMTRLCSYVDFRVHLDAKNEEIVSLSMGAEGIKLKDMTHSPVAYTLGQSSILLSGIAMDDSCSIGGTGFTNTNDTLQQGGGPLLPKLDAVFALKLNINANKNTPMLFQAKVPHIAFAPGYYYRFSIKIKDKFILMAMQVVPWTTVVTNTTGGTASSGDVIGAVNWDALITQGYDMGNGTGGSVLVGSWIVQSWSTSGGTNPTGGLTGSDWVVNTHWTSDLGTTYGYYQLSTGTWLFTTATTQGGTTPTNGFVLQPWTVNPNWETDLGIGAGTGGTTIGTWNFQTATTTTGGITGTSGSITPNNWDTDAATSTTSGTGATGNSTVGTWTSQNGSTTGGTGTTGTITTQGWTTGSASTTVAGASNETNSTVGSWTVLTGSSITGGTTTVGGLTAQDWNGTVTSTTSSGTGAGTTSTVGTWTTTSTTTSGGTTTTGTMTTQGWTNTTTTTTDMGGDE